jgi:hypothetical protein
MLKTSLLILLYLSILLPSGSSQLKTEPLTTAETLEITQAIRDEIYANKKWDDFWGFEASGPRGPEATFQIYVTPDLAPATGGLSGEVIYKYPPFGEVLRHFVIDQGGLVHLGGDPEHGFPWTQSDIQTIYLNDDVVCRYKQDWRRVLFEMDLSPKPLQIREAKERQRRRLGPA